jgi:hypothetical protein
MIKVIFICHSSREVAYLFKTKHDGKPIYVISLDEEFDGKITVIQLKENHTLKQESKH